jgi:hypothetical protein
MTNFTDADLRDPSPPVPGSKERAAVAARAHQLGRRRRMMQGAGALGMVAVVAVGVAALTAGGTSPGSGGQRIEAAAATTDAVPTTEAPAATTTVPAPATTGPAPAPDTAVATDAPNVATDPPASQQETAPPAPAAPTTFTVSGTISNIPQGTTLTLTLSGSGGTFTALAGPGGAYSISGVPAASYDGIWEWVANDNSATAAGRVSVTVSGDTTFSFSV